MKTEVLKINPLATRPRHISRLGHWLSREESKGSVSWKAEFIRVAGVEAATLVSESVPVRTTYNVSQE